MAEMITKSQKGRIMRLFKKVLDALDLSQEGANAIINAKAVMQSEIKPILQKLAIADPRFGPAVKEFDLTVPNTYDHSTQIDISAEKIKKQSSTYYFNTELIGSHYENVTHKLVPGKTYKIKIFPLLETVTSEDCILFLKKQNAVFVGAHGSSLLYDQAKDHLPKGKWSVSFDTSDALFKDNEGCDRVPYICADSNGNFRFCLGYYERTWDPGHCIICFCE